MLDVLITWVMASAIAMLTAFWLLHSVPHLAPQDMPGGRKQHQQSTPLIGGLIIFSGLLPLIIIMPSLKAAPFLVLMNITVLLGVLDDRYELSARLRLLSHLAIGLAMVLWAGVSLTSLGHLFGGSELSLGWLAIPVTCFAVAASMNAVNMVDGVDGLAGALCLLPILVVSGFVYNAHENTLLLQTAAVIGGLLVFLLLNFPFPWRQKAACFLGDTGSTLLGLAVAWFLIAGAQQEFYRPIFAVFLLAVPLTDTAGVMLRRLLRGVSMSTPGRDHLHHVLIDSGMSSRHATILIVVIAVLVATFGLFLELREAPEWLMFLILIGFLVANLVLLRSAEKAKSLIRDRWFS